MSASPVRAKSASHERRERRDRDQTGTISDADPDTGGGVPVSYVKKKSELRPEPE